jgi:integrase/recombinase XerD
MAGDLAPGDDELARLIAEYHHWLAVERGLAANSRAAYRRDLRRYEAWLRARGVVGLAAVGDNLVHEYVTHLRSRRADDGRPQFAPSSIARSLVAVRSFHRFCVQEGEADSDPTELVGAPRVPQGIPKALREDEIEAVLRARVECAGDDPLACRDQAILELLYGSGLRISELVGLDLDALDLDDGMVRVLGKGDKERVVPVGRSARAALHAYLDRARPRLRGVAVRRRGDSDAVFLNARGGRITRQGCWKLVREAGARAGLGESLSPHVLRHSCATHMLDHGADIRVVQELLGHASVSTTQVYTKVTPKRLRAVYDAAHPRARAATSTM